MKLEIDTNQFAQLIKDIGSKVSEAREEALDEIAKFAQDHASNTPLFKTSGVGGLRDSIKIIPQGQEARIILADKPYAQYVEHGRPGFSVRNAKALRFVINGEVIFRKSVGPAAPKPFMAQAAQATQDEAPKILNRILAKKLK